MKKQYTKKQIQEAINYWKKQLKALNENYTNHQQWIRDLDASFQNLKNNPQLWSDVKKGCDKLFSNVNIYNRFKFNKDNMTNDDYDLLDSYLNANIGTDHNKFRPLLDFINLLYDGLRILEHKSDYLVDDIFTFEEFYSYIILDAVLQNKTRYNNTINGVLTRCDLNELKKIFGDDKTIVPNPDYQQNQIICKKYFDKLYSLIGSKFTKRRFKVTTLWYKPVFKTDIVEAYNETAAANEINHSYEQYTKTRSESDELFEGIDEIAEIN